MEIIYLCCNSQKIVPLVVKGPLSHLCTLAVDRNFLTGLHWHSGTMAHWHNGTMAQWHSGTLLAIFTKGQSWVTFMLTVA